MQVVNGRTYKVNGMPILGIPPAEWPSNAVYIGRAGHGWSGYFGNPCGRGTCPVCGQNHRAKTAPLGCYEKWLDMKCATDEEFKNAVALLWQQSAVLVCFCKPCPCHGDILASMAARLNGEAYAASESSVAPQKSIEEFSAELDAATEEMND